jgi:hypothetical protein
LGLFEKDGAKLDRLCQSLDPHDERKKITKNC